MYYEFWNLKKPPFDNVPDPSMYVDCHASMENAVAETLFAIEEGDECIAVIVGDVGLGKTLSIRMIIDSLPQEKYSIALITNPGISFVQILQEIIGQLTGKECLEKRKVQLLEIFNRLLFATFDEGKKILIFIDEANVITPINLESLRLLTNMQGDRRNLFTMVLAGQLEFAKRLEHPKRANLFQRVGTYSRIDKLESFDMVRKYVETRLALAGATQSIFTEDAIDKLWEYSGHGIPRLINKMCKLCLKAGETNQFSTITGEIVEQIGSRFQKLTGPAMPQRRSRRSIQAETPPDLSEETNQSLAVNLVSEENILAAVDTSSQSDEEMQMLTPAYSKDASKEIISASPIISLEEAAGETKADPIILQEKAVGEARADQLVTPEAAAGEAKSDPIILQEKAAEEARADQLVTPEEAAGEAKADPIILREDAVEEEKAEAELNINNVCIKIDFPEMLLEKSGSYSDEHRIKLAGALAAETLRKNPQLMSSHFVDPVPIWQEIRDFVLDRMACVAGA